MRHIPQQQQQHRQLQWEQQQQLVNSSSEFDEFHWPSKQLQQQGAVSGVSGGKIYITPADIPPPPQPPHPHGSGGSGNSNNHSHHNGNKSRHHNQHQHHHQQQQQQLQQQHPHPQAALTTPHRTPPHRCKCEHPIELLDYDYEDATATPAAAAAAASSASALHSHRHQHPPYYYKPATSNLSGSYQLRRHSAKLHESMLGGVGGSSLDDDDLHSAGGFGGGSGMTRFKVSDSDSGTHSYNIWTDCCSSIKIDTPIPSKCYSNETLIEQTDDLSNAQWATE